MITQCPCDLKVVAKIAQLSEAIESQKSHNNETNSDSSNCYAIPQAYFNKHTVVPRFFFLRTYFL